jgi:hypothetical protein
MKATRKMGKDQGIVSWPCRRSFGLVYEKSADLYEPKPSTLSPIDLFLIETLFPGRLEDFLLTSDVTITKPTVR